MLQQKYELESADEDVSAEDDKGDEIESADEDISAEVNEDEEIGNSDEDETGSTDNDEIGSSDKDEEIGSIDKTARIEYQLHTCSTKSVLLANIIEERLNFLMALKRLLLEHMK